jgi:hypothetical protein
MRTLKPVSSRGEVVGLQKRKVAAIKDGIIRRFPTAEGTHTSAVWRDPSRGTLFLLNFHSASIPFSYSFQVSTTTAR